MYDDMEEVLFEWVTDLRSRNLRVSRRMIIEQAKQSSNSWPAEGGYSDS